MHYVILDTEWNQPLNFQTSAYRRYGDRLLFELIQIGAVLVSEDLKILDTISLTIRPCVYTTLHPWVHELTGLNRHDLEDCPGFPEAADTFLAWCPEDSVFLTWGDSDVSVFHQNLAFHQMEVDVPPFYDVQAYMTRRMNLDHCLKLSLALEQMGLEPEEDRPLHNALNDAWYTAQIFTRLPDPAGVTSCRLTPKPLQHREPATRQTDLFESVSEALSSSRAQEPHCCICAGTSSLQGSYVPQSYSRFVGLARCPRHGQQLVRIRFERQDGLLSMTVRSVRASRYNIAYVHTKQMQMQEKALAGHHMDPDHAAIYASGGDLPLTDNE